jgi:sugar phosphate isomerase/epimerase
MTRRTFVSIATAGVASAGAPARLRLGGPLFLKTDDPAALAREHRRLGYSAAYCPNVQLSDVDRIEAIRKAFAAADIVIAEVGAWVNMMDADSAKRRSNLSYVADRLRLAEQVGARNCVDISGSMHPTQWDGPDARNYSREFFDATVENCRKVIDAVKPRRAKFTIEMMPWTVPDGPDEYLRLIKAVDRPAFAVHVDVCNIVNSTQRFFENSRLIEECFRKLAPWIMSCHAKDLRGQRVHLAETVPGRGGIDYRAYLRNIATYAPQAPLMLEHLNTSEEYDEGKRYIQKIAAELGLSFA